MEFFSHPVIAVVLLLGALIFFHELGHFLVGKAFGIGVEVFSIGFGPVILSFQRGETNYRLSVIPLGGYVKFCGAVRSEEVPPHLKGKEFYRAPLIGRILTVAAGPAANFLLAIFVFAALGMYGLKQPPATIGQVVPDSPAQKAGIQFQDQITEANGKAIGSWRDLQRVIEESPGKSMDLTINRDGESLQMTIVPDTVDDSELARAKGRIGITPLHVPSVVTIASPDGPAAKAGLHTGMRITGVVENGETKPILYWEELRHYVSNLAESGQRELTVVALEVDPKELEVREDVDPQTYQVVLPEYEAGAAPSMESMLGVLDSQLTIGKLNEEIEGLLPGDRLLTWNGKPLEDPLALGTLLSENRQASADLEILRDGVKQSISVGLKPMEVQRAEGKVTLYTIPVTFWGPLEYPEWITEQYKNPFSAIAYGISETAYITKTIAGAVAGLFSGDIPLKALGGPIAIAKVASDSVKLGWQTFLISMAWLSVNLGLLNLIPIPVLDGGQLVLLFTEGAMRRPLSEIIVENYQKIGFVMVLALVVMATYNDISRFWTAMLRGMTSMF